MPKEVLRAQMRGLRDCFVDFGGVCALIVLPINQAGSTKRTVTLKVAVWSVFMRIVSVPLAARSENVLKGMHANPITNRYFIL